ncbi:MAG: TetR/AcrR family transcriptional regulator [Ignavibacteriaceae bacterium]
MEKGRKLQIIKAADKRFSKHGLGKTTLDEVARDLRIGKATIYHYFNSKEELFFETINWESSQIIEDVKAIFNNEQKDIHSRFIEYFTFKESLNTRYKLIYEIILIILKDEGFEKEAEIIKNLIKKEEEILSLAISSLYAAKIENMKPGLPLLFVLQSWGVLFSSKLSTLSDSNKAADAKEIFYKDMDKILPKS